MPFLSEQVIRGCTLLTLSVYFALLVDEIVTLYLWILVINRVRKVQRADLGGDHNMQVGRAKRMKRITEVN